MSATREMRKCRWSFDDERVYDGFTDDSYWNGFLNIWLTWETHQQVLKDYAADVDESGLAEIKPDPHGGLVSYSYGFATSEVLEGWEDRDPDACADCERSYGPGSPCRCPSGCGGDSDDVVMGRADHVAGDEVQPDLSDERRARIVQRIKDEIADLMRDGVVPGTVVRSFEALHDYVDANCLGGLCEGALPDMSDERVEAFVNSCQDAVGAWLAAGGHIAGRLHPGLEEEAAAESIRQGMGICDGCNGVWTDGAYCPSCGVYAEGGDLGRCPDCGAATEYVNEAWRHVDPLKGCFLYDSRQHPAVVFKHENVIDAEVGQVPVGPVYVRRDGASIKITDKWVTLTDAKELARILQLPLQEG